MPLKSIANDLDIVQPQLLQVEVTEQAENEQVLMRLELQSASTTCYRNRSLSFSAAG